MSDQTVSEVNLAEVAGVTSFEEQQQIAKENEVHDLITFDQLVMNFLQQHADTLAEYHKLKEALDNMHYTTTITKISLEELQLKKDHLNKLAGAIEGLALYKKYVDPTVTDKEFTFEE
jgi:hypothetical protein